MLYLDLFCRSISKMCPPIIVSSFFDILVYSKLFLFPLLLSLLSMSLLLAQSSLSSGFIYSTAYLVFLT